MAHQVKTLGSGKTREYLTEQVQKKSLKPDDFSIRELTEAFLGREFVASLHPKSGRRVALTEADGLALAYSDFTGITGQIFYTRIRDAYESEEFVFTKLVESKPTTILDMEKFPGVSNVGDEFSVIGEGEEYPNFGVSQDYTHRAALEKRGGKIAVTREIIIGDKTGLLLDRCKKLGDYLGLNREKRIIDAFIDENGGAASAVLRGHRYHWMDTSYASYQTSTPWINVQTSNALVDFTDVENAWLRLVAITDPYTGEPIRIQAKHLVVTPQNVMTARRILTATNVQTHVGGYATTGNLQDMHAPSPLQSTIGSLQVVSSQLLAARAATDTDWWLGDIGKVVKYATLWDIETEEAPAFTKEAFDRDIVSQFKASEMGRAYVDDPRYAVENRA